MSRLGLRQIRKPNTRGAAFLVEEPRTITSVDIIEQVTNGLQTGNKEVTEQVTNGLQTGNKEVTEQAVHSLPTAIQNSKRVTERVTKKALTGNKEVTEQVTNLSWSTLRGHEAKLLDLIFDECRSNGDLLSPPLTLDRIAEYLGSRKGTAKTITIRLVRKGFVKRESSATGRGGFTRFRISQGLYHALLLRKTGNKQVTSESLTGNKEVTERVTERVTSPSSSSSYIELEKFKTTTTGDPELFEYAAPQLSPEWQTVDCSPLEEFGFTQTHLLQIIRQGKLQPTEVQDSICFFAFDLNRNGKARVLNGSPLNFFMGILRKGIPYAPPENYESPVDEARRKTREFKERKERERKTEEQKILEIEFSEWRRGLDPDEIAKIVPEFARNPGPIQEAALSSYFETHVYSNREAARSGDPEMERTQIRAAIAQSFGEIT